MSESKPPDRPTQRAPELRWVPIKEMRVSPKAQREYRPAHAAQMAADFDLEALGYPVLNRRGAIYYIVDGQHRIEALKMIGFENDSIQCECYENLTEAQEADLFLRRDERRRIAAFDKFRIAVTAERAAETEIDRIVRTNGLKVSSSQADGCIRAVATLKKVYTRAGGEVLGRTLRIIRDSYGQAGFDAVVIDGIALLCQRYNDELAEEIAVEKLSKVHGGVNGLLGKAGVLRKQSGSPKTHCTAAAAVDIINAGRGGRRLAPWWQSNDGKA